MIISYKLQDSAFNGGVPIHVCHRAFCNVYAVSNSTKKTTLRRIKKGEFVIPRAQDHNAGARPSTKAVTKDMLQRGIEIEREAIGTFQFKNSHRQFKARAWMKQYFNLIGDPQPNSYGEVHLDSSFSQDLVHE